MLHIYMDSKDSYYNSTLTIIIDPTSIKHKNRDSRYHKCKC